MNVVDARGEQCPVPVVKAKKAMDGMKAGQVLEVCVDNETAVQNVSKMAASQGAEYKTEQIKENDYKIIITVGKDGEKPAGTAEHPMMQAQASGKTVVVISSDKMGNGNDELGKVLMKGFVYALTELEKRPDTVLLYNGGAQLSAEGSDSLEDLQKLHEAGTEVYTCGTCLNYYELSDKLKVGSVTNMYDIVERVSEAGRVIRP